jgi:hypothetical protein
LQKCCVVKILPSEQCLLTLYALCWLNFWWHACWQANRYLHLLRFDLSIAQIIKNCLAKKGKILHWKKVRKRRYGLAWQTFLWHCLFSDGNLFDSEGHSQPEICNKTVLQFQPGKNSRLIIRSSCPPNSIEPRVARFFLLQYTKTGKMYQIAKKCIKWP